MTACKEFGLVIKHYEKQCICTKLFICVAHFKRMLFKQHKYLPSICGVVKDGSPGLHTLQTSTFGTLLDLFGIFYFGVFGD